MRYVVRRIGRIRDPFGGYIHAKRETLRPAGRSPEFLSLFLSFYFPFSVLVFFFRIFETILFFYLI